MGLESYRRKVSESKRRSIMEAARAEFHGQGFTHAAMAEIARKADVSTATLYKHFGSKEELFGAIVEESYEALGLECTHAESCKSAAEGLNFATDEYLTAQFSLGLNSLMRAVISETAGDPDVGRDFFKRGINSRNDDLQTFLDKLVERGLLTPHDTAISTRQISGMMTESLILPAIFDPDYTMPDNKDEIIGSAIETFLARYGIDA